MPSQGRKHILSRLPLRQGSLPKSKGTLGNNFSRRICQWRVRPRSSSKTPLSWKKKSNPQKNFRVEKWKIANRLKRVFPKFRADRSHVRGVNGRSKFSEKIFLAASAGFASVPTSQVAVVAVDLLWGSPPSAGKEIHQNHWEDRCYGLCSLTT